MSTKNTKNTNTNDRLIFNIYISLGIPLLILYGVFMTYTDKKTLNNFWTNDGKNRITSDKIRNVYKVSMILAMIAGIYLMFYLASRPNNDQILYMALMSLIAYSIIWIPTFGYPKINTLVLLIVGLSALAILYKIRNDNNVAGILAASYLFFHTFFLDFIVWSGFI